MSRGMRSQENGVMAMERRRLLGKMEVNNSEEELVGRRRERLVHYYGPIKGEEVGKTYRTRDKLKIIHHPDKSWIHLGPEGPYSILVQGKRRFLDEGSLVIIFTKAPVGSAESDKNNACNTILGNLKKAVKGRLPIRVIRLVKSDRDRKTVFRYDGLYVMKKKLILYEKLHFLMIRIRNQPKVLFNLKRGSCKIRRLLALKKRKKQIKKEPELKKEVISNSDTERDCSNNIISPAEIVGWDQLKEEFTTLREEGAHEYDDGYEVWQRSALPSFVKADSNEQLEEESYFNYEEHVEKIETYYEEPDDTIDDLDNEDQEHFSKEDVIIESIPFLKSENGESNNSVRTILAIVPESGTSEYVEENADTDFDPLGDPLGGFSDESKSSNCDEIKNNSQEVKTCYDEKKNQLYLAECGNIDCSEKGQFLPIMPHPCLYNLTIGHLINLLGNRSHNHSCPCSSKKCATQKNFEVALRALIDEGGKKDCNPKCLKGIEDDDMKQLENTEINYFSALDNVFNQLNALISNKTSINDSRTSLIGKRQHVMTTRILKKDKTITKNYRSKKVIEKALVPPGDKEPFTSSGDEEYLLSTSAEGSLSSSIVEESLVPSEVSSLTNTVNGATSPIPEDTAIRLPLENPLEKPREEQDTSDGHVVKRRRGRQKGTRTSSREAALLGPVIPTEEPKPIPRQLRGKKISYRGATFYISPRTTSSRSASRRRVQEEEEDAFLGFVGPIKPSKKLRLVRSFLSQLLGMEQSSSMS